MEVPFLVNRQIVMWRIVVGAWNDNKQVAKSKLTVRNKFHQFWICYEVKVMSIVITTRAKPIFFRIIK
jgi:hypothetical protein